MQFSYILGSDSITVFLDKKSYSINKQANTYKLVLEAVKQQNVHALRQALEARNEIVKRFKTSGVEIVVDPVSKTLTYNGRNLQGLIGSRVFEMLALGLDVTPMVEFIKNLMQNPSKRAVDELFGFMDACDLPITPDGHFLAYKKIRENYKDVYSGTMDNSVGKIVEMPRNAVEEDKDKTCSYGLHFCSKEYLKHFSGERVVVLKINPRDVVSIPSDYNNSKGRTCRYEVVDELPAESGLPVQYLDKAATTKSYTKEEPKFNPNNVLSDADVRCIRYELKAGTSVKEVANMFDVSERTIRRIRAGQTYKHVV